MAGAWSVGGQGSSARPTGVVCNPSRARCTHSADHHLECIGEELLGGLACDRLAVVRVEERPQDRPALFDLSDLVVGVAGGVWGLHEGTRTKRAAAEVHSGLLVAVLAGEHGDNPLAVSETGNGQESCHTKDEEACSRGRKVAGAQREPVVSAVLSSWSAEHSIRARRGQRLRGAHRGPRRYRRSAWFASCSVRASAVCRCARGGGRGAAYGGPGAVESRRRAASGTDTAALIQAAPRLPALWRCTRAASAPRAKPQRPLCPWPA